MRLLLDTSAYSAFKRGHTAAVDLLRSATLIGLNVRVLTTDDHFRSVPMLPVEHVSVV